MAQLWLGTQQKSIAIMGPGVRTWHPWNPVLPNASVMIGLLEKEVE